MSAVRYPFSLVFLALLGCAAPRFHYTTVRDDRVPVTLTPSAHSAVIAYESERIRFGIDSSSLVDFIRAQRDSTIPDAARARIVTLTREARERAIHSVIDSGRTLTLRSDQDRFVYLVADLLASGRGTLIDRRTGNLVTEITVNAFGERCGPALCGHDGRRFLLRDGTVFLTVIDMWY